jgi:molybdate transport system substrate-binding protein
MTVVAASLATLVACGGDERLVVFAASSLTDAFGQIEVEFETVHPTIDVVVSFDGSSALAGQIGQGAPADVFASADRENMERASDDADGTPQIFARNRLVLAVEPGNPHGVTGLADLGRDDLVVILAAPEVPAGAYAAAALARAGVTAAPASLEQNVRAVAAKIALGEADVGVVYTTDLAANEGRVEGVSIPEAANVVAEYPIVVVDEGDAAADFVEFVLGEAGRGILVDHGFEVP